MKNLLILTLTFFISAPLFSQPFTWQQVLSDGNNISTWIGNTGVFNNDNRTTNTPGFQWPKGSNKFAIYTTGLTTAAYINDSLRFASASFSGEYRPGCILNGVLKTDSTFKLYKVSRGDNNSNPDYANWGLMIPFGTPYEDVNNNGSFEAGIDKPGMKNAAQTIFICMTDGDSNTHTYSEGFGGGTKPLKAEMHLTVWSYDNFSSMQDVQFVRMEMVNRNSSSWNKTYFGLFCDPDLGSYEDDYLGCDTLRNLGYCYNGDNIDGTGGSNHYGANPPAVGIDMLSGAVNKSVTPNLSLAMTSFVYVWHSGSETCAIYSQISSEAYNYLRGLKKDSTPYINMVNMQPSKYCYSGDPETNTGWNEQQGQMLNCGGSLVGPVWIPSPPNEMRFVMSSGADNFTVAPGEKQTFIFAQMMARGSNNLNSVTKLKQLDDAVQVFYENGFNVGINTISTEVPGSFSLYQNYPNPFNPSTKIKFEIPLSEFVNITVYDLTGKVIEELVNQNLNAGVYETEFSAKNISTGIYFYRLKTPSFTQTKRMILIK